MIKLVVAMSAVLALAGCATLDSRISTVTASEQFARICSAAPAVHLAFVAISSQTNISDSIKNGEANAYRVIDTTCRSKPTNTVEALETVLTAYQRILDAQTTVAARVTP